MFFERRIMVRFSITETRCTYSYFSCNCGFTRMDLSPVWQAFEFGDFIATVKKSVVNLVKLWCLVTKYRKLCEIQAFKVCILSYTKSYHHYKSIQNSQILYDCIFHILCNFLTELNSFTKFMMVVPMLCLNFPNSKVCLKGKMSIDTTYHPMSPPLLYFRMIQWEFRNIFFMTTEWRGSITWRRNSNTNATFTKRGQTANQKCYNKMTTLTAVWLTFWYETRHNYVTLKSSSMMASITICFCPNFVILLTPLWFDFLAGVNQETWSIWERSGRASRPRGTNCSHRSGIEVSSIDQIACLVETCTDNIAWYIMVMGLG